MKPQFLLSIGVALSLLLGSSMPAVAASTTVVRSEMVAKYIRKPRPPRVPRPPRKPNPPRGPRPGDECINKCPPGQICPMICVKRYG